MEQLRPSVRGYVQLDDRMVIILKHKGAGADFFPPSLLHVCGHVPQIM